MVEVVMSLLLLQVQQGGTQGDFCTLYPDAGTDLALRNADNLFMYRSVPLCTLQFAVDF